MVKNELLAKIAEKTTMAKVDVDKVLKAFEEVVTSTLAEDKEEKITFGGLGSFKVKEVSERSGIIQMGDRKGQTYTTPAHEEITFKMSKSAKVLA